MNQAVRLPDRILITDSVLLVVTFLYVYFAFQTCPEAQAESSSPTLHWGGLAYPDQYSKLELGYFGNRFTEFDGNGRRYNNIKETMGLNFGSISWTQHSKQWDGWSTNLTVGAGPTGEQPTRYLQNEFIHNAIFGIPIVAVHKTRDQTDFMIDGSVTRWAGTNRFPRIFFMGVGVSGGSLYFEEFARAGIRHLPIMCALFTCDQFRDSAQLLKGVHLSGLARISGIQNGTAFHDLAPQSYLGQALSVGEFMTMKEFRSLMWKWDIPWTQEFSTISREIHWKSDSGPCASRYGTSRSRPGTIKLIERIMDRPMG